ncbi:hypothetical protein [Brevibacterium sp. NPDC059310]|uniref:hypothetical protein n=1 Tax=Brevibacterium sp. NPDC059310 TaxID=3346802 RepID=UPI00366D729A
MPSPEIPSAPTHVDSTTRPDYRSTRARIHLALLIVVTGLLAIGTSVVFAPGGMNPDTRWQLLQVLGNEPLSDWHPAIMTITWMWLAELTGHASAVLYVQVLLMFVTGFGFALYLFDVTRSRAWSWVGLLFLLAPHLFTYIGVLWKDTQMAEMFFAAVVCALLAQRFKRLRWILLIIGLLALTYGTAVRKNAFFAVLPLIYLLSFSVFAIRSARPRTSWRKRLLSPAFAATTAAVLVLVLGSGAILNAIYQPLKTHQVSQVMLDDVVFTVPGSELRTTEMDPQLRENLLAAQKVCREKDAYEDSYWRCYGRGADGIYTAIEHVDELQDLWMRTVLTRPDRYLLYRTQTFSHLLFDNYTDWDGTTVENDLGWETKYKQANDAAETYVEKFGARDLSWLFTGWFWLLAAVLGLVCLRHVRRLEASSGLAHLTTTVTTLSLSSLIYIVGYFPIVPANHFRYIYWPALAMSMAAIMLAAAGSLAWQAKRRPEPADPGAGADPAAPTP